ncbi:16S rRNA (cytosine(1402)-N(4))-methyltransferase RsmH [Marinobacterium sediminicola]|uniref:Ribosomal RNA small subunit methyltransferase H n=1 Tax=Marinobacterium sediminicola TaxID=518898 RepID=A0ABY1RWT8_9GAMM|nr:16S rRNA (cytosine(1402)-N(4))-methyltransferase RsmH [Marinobacterium sediminicola]ULG70213.1 16S rRNA (cytosine(1402)-N(4))-methyltransferase RsmH [Marinobacterium sediminicola]SMR70080.1 16S rRNA (cytosine1402-N4)-methyltransferase [Marinobacterium sediminicola]
MSQTFSHITVLLNEAVKELVQDPDGFYIDGTFGRGGHSALVLEQLSDNGHLMAIDKDPEAIRHAHVRFADEPRFSIEHGSFAQLQSFVEQRGMMGKVSGVLLDLGVSSPQLDDPERGFSFLNDGPLDMRMDTTSGESAADWVNRASETEIADVIYQYGEERFSRRMARAIVAEREQEPITTTARLAKIISEANPRWEKGKHPATRAFQGIRIHINRELADVEACLDQALEVLAPGGRLVVISFHSLEDRIVKRFIRRHVKGDEHIPPGVPVTDAMLKRRLKSAGKAIRAGKDELNQNPRARSAVMRAAIKLA